MIFGNGIENRITITYRNLKDSMGSPFLLGSYRAIIGADCESAGSIQYTYVMYVFKDTEKHPCLAVTSEYVDEEGQEDSRFLCMFFGGAHHNFSVSKAWGDLDTFIQKALEIIIEPLEISDTPKELLL